MPFQLPGKVALVTGTTQGLGRAIALDLTRRGVAVVGTGRRKEIGDQLVEEITAEGGRFTFCEADVSVFEDCERAAATTVKTYGRIDILVNNAGTSYPLKRVEYLRPQDWRNVAGPTLDGTLYQSIAVLPYMQARRNGVILNMASGAGVVTFGLHASYGMAKAAVIHLSRIIAVENLNTGVRANSLVIGAVPTELLMSAFTQIGRSVHGQDWMPNAPEPTDEPDPGAEILLTPQDVANVIALLCTDEAREITGASINVDRGLAAGAFSAKFIEMSASQTL